MLRRLIRRFLVRQDGLHPQFRHWRFSGILIFNCCSHVLFAQAHHSMFCPLFFLPLGLLQRCTGLIIICLNAKLLVTARCVSASLPRAVPWPAAARLARSARAFCSCGEYPNGFFLLLHHFLKSAPRSQASLASMEQSVVKSGFDRVKVE